MKSVMLSIDPKWCELIASGKKTIELRKTKPRLETPFKCYIYCTGFKYFYSFGGQRVIGEFVCENIQTYHADDFVGDEMPDGTIRDKPVEGEYAYWIPHQDRTCLSYTDILEYGKGKTLYGWYISDLKLYDKPKELSEFRRPCKYRLDDGSCKYKEVGCDFVKFDFNPDGTVNLAECCNYMSRSPKSWCYVEEIS